MRGSGWSSFSRSEASSSNVLPIAALSSPSSYSVTELKWPDPGGDVGLPMEDGKEFAVGLRECVGLSEKLPLLLWRPGRGGGDLVVRGGRGGPSTDDRGEPVLTGDCTLGSCKEPVRVGDRGAAPSRCGKLACRRSRVPKSFV